MAFDHLFWTYRETPNACWLKGLSGFRRSYKINKGKTVAAELPGDASFSMDSEYPTDTLTPDLLTNESAMLVVSTRLKEFLAENNLPQVEYLPITVFNHRQRALDPHYWIVNPLEEIPCLDMSASGPTWNVLDKESLESFSQWALDDEKCEVLPPLFRATGLKRYPLIHRALAAQIDARGFTGNAWLEPSVIVGARIPADLRVLVRR